MTSSLFGFYTSQRSLLVNQAAINIVSNNITNINTTGYSKQRLELSQQTLLTTDCNDPLIASQSGIGSVIDTISRNRDVYIDSSYRTANSNYAYSTELYDNVSLIEDITNGLSDTGLTAALTEFYTAAQDLNNDPSNTVVRTCFLQRALDVATNFNQAASQLTTIRTNLIGDVDDPNTLNVSKINLDCNDLNNKLKAVADLNKTISLATSQGTAPNSLLDERDNLLDEISEYIPITVTGGSNNSISISMNGTNLVTDSQQVGYFKYELKDTSVDGDWDTNPPVVKIQDVNGRDILKDASSKITSGKIGAILDVTSSDENKPTINNTLDNLNTLANEFASQINAIQTYSETDDPAAGSTTKAMCIDNTGSTPVLKEATENIFLNNDTGTNSNITAENITINNALISDPTKIATARITYTTASGPSSTDLAGTGNGNNSLLIVQLESKSLANLNNLTTEEYLNSVSSNFGVQVKSVESNLDSNDAILQQISTKRESTSGVNLDEEYTDLIKYQRSYEASAKIFDVMDKVLQTIIALGS